MRSVDEKEIDPFVRLCVAFALVAALELKALKASPVVRWVNAAEMKARGRMGFVLPLKEPGVVNLCSGLTAKKAAHTAAHEVYHLWEAENGRFTLGTDPASEREADRFADLVGPMAVLRAERLLEAWRAEKAAEKTSGCGCGCKSDSDTLEDVVLRHAEKLRRAPYPWRNRAVPLKAFAAWNNAVLSDDGPAIKAMTTDPDAWLASILEERERYVADVCSRSQYSSLPMCQSRTKTEPEEEESLMAQVLRGLRMGRLAAVEGV